METSRPPAPGPDAGRRPRRTLGSAALVGLVLLALAVSSAAFRAWVLPWPHDGALADKLAYYEAHRDAYDVLFIGSSRVAHGYMPEIIDPILSEAGFPLRSFNLGIDAMTSFEADFLLRRVLARPSPRLRYVVIELETWTPPRSNNPRFDTERSVFWHDTRQTAQALRSLRSAPMDVKYKVKESLEHLRLYGKRALNIGRGVRRIADITHPPAAEVTLDDLHRRAGFQPYDPSTDEEHARVHRRFLERDAAEFPAKVLALAAVGDSDAALDGFNLDALVRQRELVEAAGPVPVYAMGPTIKPKPYLRPLARSGVVPVLFDFSRPDEYPELYAVDERFDDDHLTLAGAERFSRVFAERFVRYLAMDAAAR